MWFWTGHATEPFHPDQAAVIMRGSAVISELQPTQCVGSRRSGVPSGAPSPHVARSRWRQRL
jgi:hypothetical protein